jgi:hypothetical protein
MNERRLKSSFQFAIVRKNGRENLCVLPSSFDTFGHDGVNDASCNAGTAVGHLIVHQLHIQSTINEFNSQGGACQASADNQYVFWLVTHVLLQ